MIDTLVKLHRIRAANLELLTGWPYKPDTPAYKALSDTIGLLNEIEGLIEGEWGPFDEEED